MVQKTSTRSIILHLAPGETSTFRMSDVRLSYVRSLVSSLKSDYAHEYSVHHDADSRHIHVRRIR